jgi:hypothetical protein
MNSIERRRVPIAHKYAKKLSWVDKNYRKEANEISNKFIVNTLIAPENTNLFEIFVHFYLNSSIEPPSNDPILSSLWGEI